MSVSPWSSSSEGASASIGTIDSVAVRGLDRLPTATRPATEITVGVRGTSTTTTESSTTVASRDSMA